MTNEQMHYTPENLFNEVSARAQEQGVTEQAAWDDLVEQTIEQHRQVGEMHTDDPTEDLGAHVKGRWADYKATLV